MTFNEITLSAAFFAQLDERVSVFWCRQDDVTQLKPYVSDSILCDSKRIWHMHVILKKNFK